MSEQTIEQLRGQAVELVNQGQVEQARALFEQIADRDAGAADSWINLATAERALGKNHLAVEHYRRGVELLRAAKAEDRGLLASALHALGAALEALELTDEAVAAYRESAGEDPRAPTPLAALSTLLARAGHLELADKTATEYCLAAVSILAEKGNIAAVRKFQRAIKDAGLIDGEALLAATREAYVKSFAETASKLPEGARLEVEPHRHGPQGLLPVLANPTRPWSRVRFDALNPSTGERWMIQDAPTYGFPRGVPAAADGFFSVPYRAGTPFPVLIATRTAWDYFFVRLRFSRGLGPQTVERAEQLIGGWYLRGVSGEFAQSGAGYFHFLSEPTPIGADGLRYEVDLGLSQLSAIPALFEALGQLHASDPIEVAVLGDGALPLKG